MHEQGLYSVIVVKVADEHVATPTSAIENVVTLPHVTPVPLMPAAIAGLVNVKGVVATVLSWCPSAQTPGPRARQGDQSLMFHVGSERILLRIDEVVTVTSASRSEAGFTCKGQTYPSMDLTGLYRTIAADIRKVSLPPLQ